MLLAAICGFFLVSFALWFGAGWYVRAGYPPRRGGKSAEPEGCARAPGRFLGEL
jgi:hypothetical protein